MDQYTEKDKVKNENNSFLLIRQDIRTKTHEDLTNILLEDYQIEMKDHNYYLNKCQELQKMYEKSIAQYQQLYQKYYQSNQMNDSYSKQNKEKDQQVIKLNKKIGIIQKLDKDLEKKFKQQSDLDEKQVIILKSQINKLKNNVQKEKKMYADFLQKNKELNQVILELSINKVKELQQQQTNNFESILLNQKNFDEDLKMSEIQNLKILISFQEVQIKNFNDQSQLLNANILSLRSIVTQNELLNQMDKKKQETKNQQIQSQVGELQSQVGELQSQVGELKPQVGELQSQLGELQTKQAEIHNLVKSIQEQIDKNNEKKKLSQKKFALIYRSEIKKKVFKYISLFILNGHRNQFEELIILEKKNYQSVVEFFNRFDLEYPKDFEFLEVVEKECNQQEGPSVKMICNKQHYFAKLFDTDKDEEIQVYQKIFKVLSHLKCLKNQKK